MYPVQFFMVYKTLISTQLAENCQSQNSSRGMYHGADNIAKNVIGR